MSNISSNSLFHFTPKREYLLNILRQTFVPRYCFEEIQLSDQLKREKFESAIPMVCFCDISLSQISNHIKTYGEYGIGMTKEWGIRNKLNPIIYINPNSNVSESISKLAESVYQALDKYCGEVTKGISDEFMNLSNFLKPYKGNFKRGDKIYKNVRFYNEREWRYVPKIEFDSDVGNYLDKSHYSKPEVLQEENAKLLDYRLGFKPKDIKYIFVKDDNEIHQMMTELRNIKQRFSPKEIDILTSKIITTKQIKEDF
ncbi:hypothetical protein GTQ34_13650 [Muricauda sp. JGD-17]|uniref:Abortive phage resistance protein AbiGi (Putative antitoxin) n=1 Tax=Flagellimonas ochracea TaxID=2696472 RepID=A0A964WYM2_9FLAO|nr:abortive infection system antitoxin AbiGi family protein [Allomuricauda ochracea]NAY92963.1 hypothetical protein [Allomuricauda ochracea]